MRNLLILTIFFFILTACSNHKANEPAKAENKIFSKQEYLQDIDQLANTIISNHPRPFEFISEDKFWALVSAKKNKITDQTTYREFIWDMSELSSSIGCGHSSFRWFFNQEIDLLRIDEKFPLDVKVFDKKLYVIDPLVNSRMIDAGDEILEINGEKVSAILKGVYSHMFADANLLGSKRTNFNIQANSYLAYYFKFAESYEVLLAGKRSKVQLSMLTSYDYKPMIKESDPCQDALCLEFINKDTAKLTIRTFDYYGERSPIFDEFVNSSFASIKEGHVKNLIIDVRGNGGGNSFSAAYLLAHIADKPYTFFRNDSPSSERLKKPIEPYPNSFRGQTYIITDGSDGSTTGFMLALAKHNKFAKIVGSDLGSSFTTNGGYKNHDLTNTGLLYRISTAITITTADSFVYGEAIQPDYKVTQTIEGYIKDKDTILNYTLNLIKEN